MPLPDGVSTMKQALFLQERAPSDWRLLVAARRAHPVMRLLMSRHTARTLTLVRKHREIDWGERASAARAAVTAQGGPAREQTDATMSVILTTLRVEESEALAVFFLHAGSAIIRGTPLFAVLYALFWASDFAMGYVSGIGLEHRLFAYREIFMHAREIVLTFLCSWTYLRAFLLPNKYRRTQPLEGLSLCGLFWVMIVVTFALWHVLIGPWLAPACADNDGRSSLGFCNPCDDMQYCLERKTRRVAWSEWRADFYFVVFIPFLLVCARAHHLSVAPHHTNFHLFHPEGLLSLSGLRPHDMSRLDVYACLKCVCLAVTCTVAYRREYGSLSASTIMVLGCAGLFAPIPQQIRDSWALQFSGILATLDEDRVARLIKSGRITEAEYKRAMSWPVAKRAVEP
jgi:hypothetical protein